ncbi:dynein light chain type 1-domain-containing protein, partial [Cantharellus anzutake]|uniref:dynein light chain type 1-domain-containing protein n=2 Tax=Cantharellus anzutake TaxID=1750568 RepID=UPI0019051BA9
MAEPEPAASTGTDPFNQTGAKVVIKNVDMTEDMQQATVDISIAALEKFAIEKDIASHIKREFDTKYGPTWHVVVGKNFGSYVTH